MYRARVGSVLASKVFRRSVAADLRVCRRVSSGVVGSVVPNTCSNEAGAVCEEFLVCDELAFFLDFSESPDFEVVRCLGDVTGYVSLVYEASNAR